LAARGARDLDDGEQRVEDSTELRQIRRQALGVVLRGSLIGAALTAVVLLLP
jgi:hypothetical protein